MAGAESKDSARVVLSPLSRINSTKGPTDASVGFLEPSGKSIELSFQYMEQLADEAKRLGARHLTSKIGNVTARAVSLDDQKSVNNLQTWCIRLDVLLRQVLEAVAEWLNAGELPEQVQPRVYKEFSAVANAETGARWMQVLTPALSKRELLTEGVRYGGLRPDFPVDENLAELEKEQAAIAVPRHQFANGMAIRVGAVFERHVLEEVVAEVARRTPNIPRGQAFLEHRRARFLVDAVRQIVRQGSEKARDQLLRESTDLAARETKWLARTADAVLGFELRTPAPSLVEAAISRQPLLGQPWGEWFTDWVPRARARSSPACAPACSPASRRRRSFLRRRRDCERRRSGSACATTGATAP
jgi:hypothetical protein